MIALANIMCCLDFSLGDYFGVYSSTSTSDWWEKNAMFEKAAAAAARNLNTCVAPIG